MNSPLAYWPVFQETEAGNKFWNRNEMPAFKKILYSFEMKRIGWKKPNPISYNYTITNEGVLYYKNNKIKGWVQLNDNYGVKLIDLKMAALKQDLVKSIRIKKNSKVHIYLWHSDYQITLQLFKYLAQYCFCQNFDQLYNIHDIVGKGGFSKVYLLSPTTKLIDQRTQYAGKVYSVNDVNLRKDLNRFHAFIHTEAYLLRKIDSPYIIKLYEIIQLDEVLILVTDYLKGGSLYTYLKEKKILTEHEAQTIIFKISQGLQAVHKLGYVHRDIKLENVLIDKESDKIKLIDFGFAEQINRKKLINGQGTAGYIAPEVFLHQPYSEVSDVFSLGIIFYCLLAGKAAFKSNSYEGLLKINKECVIDFSEQRFPHVSTRTMLLLKSMLTKNPQNRVNLDQVLESMSQNVCIVPLTQFQTQISGLGIENTPRNTSFNQAKNSLKSFYQLSMQSISENSSKISILNKNKIKSMSFDKKICKESHFKPLSIQHSLLGQPETFCNLDDLDEEESILPSNVKYLKSYMVLFNQKKFK